MKCLWCKPMSCSEKRTIPSARCCVDVTDLGLASRACVQNFRCTLVYVAPTPDRFSPFVSGIGDSAGLTLAITEGHLMSYGSFALEAMVCPNLPPGELSLDLAGGLIEASLVHRPVFGRPFIKRFALSYRTVVCPVCL